MCGGDWQTREHRPITLAASGIRAASNFRAKTPKAPSASAALLLVLFLASGAALADDAALMREANNALAQKDYSSAFSKFSELARHGNTLAQYNVGAFYFDGMGVQRDEQQAFAWFTKAAQQGDGRAMQAIRSMAARGNPYAKTALNAIEQPSAKQRTPPQAPKASALAQMPLPPPETDATIAAQANAASARKDYPTALSKFLVLGQRGNAMAQYNAGVLYYNGMGVQRDERKAFAWFTKSAQQGNARAIQFINNMAKKGNSYAQNAYAALSQSGIAPPTARETPPEQHKLPEPQVREQKSRSGFEVGATLGETGKLKGISNSTSYGLLAGYRFDDRWSVEVAHNSLYHGANADPYIAIKYPGQTGTFDLNAFSLTGIYAWRLNERWSLLGDLGIHGSSFKVNGTGNASTTGSSKGLVVGAKVQYDVSSALSARMGFDSYLQHGDISGTLTELGIGIVFGF